MDLAENNFRFAIGVREFYSEKPINDPRHVKWVAKIIGSNTATGTRRGYEYTIDLHPCTKSDLAEFYPINEKQIAQYEEMTAKENFL